MLCLFHCFLLARYKPCRHTPFMIMDFILFLLTVHGKKIAKSCYSMHSSMRASNIISPEGKVKGSLSGYLLKVRAQTVPAVPAALDVFYAG